jgi:transcriptional regulator GlxA family with amidase domain
MIRIGLLLIDDFALMSYASLIEPFRAANNLAGAHLYEWQHVSIRGREAFASNGVTLLTDASIKGAPPFDRIFVFAAGDPASFLDEHCFGWLRQQARQGVAIGGVSGGPYLLARAGLLHGYRMTIHWEHASALREDYPDLSMEPGLYVIDRDRMTCAGGTAGLDLALALIERDHGIALARQVAEWFIRTEQRQSNVAQRLGLAERYGTRNARLLNMLGTMEDAIDEPLSRDALATEAGVSVRQLERLCAHHLQASMADIYLAIRLDHAAHLLRSTSLSVTTISVACGFVTASHFSRAFGGRFGLPPTRWAALRHSGIAATRTHGGEAAA